MPSSTDCWAPQKVSESLEPGRSKYTAEAVPCDARKQAAGPGIALVLSLLNTLAKEGT